MRLFTLLALSIMSLPAFSQVCYVDMVDRYNRVVSTFTGYGDPGTCLEGMKECRKTIRLSPHLGGVDCIRATDQVPSPQPNPNPYPNPNPRPNPNPYPNPNPNPYPPQSGDLLELAINYSLRGCHVVPRVSGWANQLYVGGVFSGNFEVGSQDNELRRRIRDLQNRGQCLMKDAQSLRLLQDPYLIQDFANYQYRNCYVKLNVSGWANQLYIRGVFSGNFDKNSEVKKLQAALVDRIMDGTCQYDPM